VETKNLTLGLALCLTIASGLEAQERRFQPGDPSRADLDNEAQERRFQPGDPSRADPGNWNPPRPKPPILDDAPVRPAPPPATSAPLTPPPTIDAPPNTAAEPSPEAQARIDAAIQKNYDDAEKLLRSTLDNKDGDYLVVKRRIDNIQQVLKRYAASRSSAEARRRALQVELFNKSVAYQRQVKRGALPPEVYEKRIAAANRDYLEERAELDSEIAFIVSEENRLQPKLQDLEAQRRLLEAERPVLKKPKLKKALSASQQLLQNLDAKVRALSALRIKRSLGNERLNGHP
jgi:hypothetical protein